MILRTSMPSGVPRTFSAGIVKLLCSPAQISYISRVALRASLGVPPTNCTMAGAPAPEGVSYAGLAFGGALIGLFALERLLTGAPAKPAQEGT